MLGIVQVEGWSVCLGFFFGFIRVGVGKRVANEMEQSIQVSREHVHFEEMQGKRRLVDKLLQTFTHFSLIALLDEFLEKAIKSLCGCSKACAKFIVGELRPAPLVLLLRFRHNPLPTRMVLLKWS